MSLSVSFSSEGTISGELSSDLSVDRSFLSFFLFLLIYRRDWCSRISFYTRWFLHKLSDKRDETNKTLLLRFNSVSSLFEVEREVELTDNGDEYQETQHQCSQNDRGIRENQPVRGRVPRLVHVFLHYAMYPLSGQGCRQCLSIIISSRNVAWSKQQTRQFRSKRERETTGEDINSLIFQ